MEYTDRSEDTRCRKNWVITIYSSYARATGYDDSAILPDQLETYLGPERDHWNNPEGWPDIRYFVGGFEKCPTTGKPHIQGYFQLKSKKSSKALCDLFYSMLVADSRVGGYLKPAFRIAAQRAGDREGDPLTGADKNVIYCKKDGRFFEWGELSRQGEKKESRLDQCVSDIKGHKFVSISDVAWEYPREYVLHARGLSALQEMSECKLDHSRSRPEMYIFVGPSGVGKTEGAKFWIRNVSEYRLPEQCYHFYDYSGGKFWDGYRGQPLVVFEEFACQLPVHEFLQIISGCSKRVHVKSSSVMLRAHVFVFTTQVPLVDWYKNVTDDRDYKAVQRRLRESGVVMPYRRPQRGDVGYFSDVDLRAKLDAERRKMCQVVGMEVEDDGDDLNLDLPLE